MLKKCNRSDEYHYLKDELYGLIKNDDSIFNFIQAGSLDGLWYWDLEQPENEWMNSKFWETFGYNPDNKKHLASEWKDLIFEEDLETALINFDKHCKDPEYPYDQIVRYRHSDGSVVWVRCRGMVIRNNEGKPIRMLGAHTELTQLMTTKEKLMKSNQALMEFAHAASHDLKSPLKSVICQIELLQKFFLQDLPDDGEKLVFNIQNSLKRMTGLIDGLLEYAKVTNTGMHKEQINTGEFIQCILEDLKSEIDATQTTVKNNVKHNIYVIPILLRQVLNNLISNAIKYRREGVNPEIIINCTEQSNCWEFAITDNGQGVEPKYHQRIFEFLQRLHSRDEVEGHGLGLCICRKAVEELGGKMWLTSSVGKGSTFYFTINK